MARHPHNAKSAVRRGGRTRNTSALSGQDAQACTSEGPWATCAPAAVSVRLTPDVRAALGSWLRTYGNLNRLVGVDRGPLSARLTRVRRHAAANTILVWTSLDRWTQTSSLVLQCPQLGIEFVCEAQGDTLVATALQASTLADPRGVPDSVGVCLVETDVRFVDSDEATEPDGNRCVAAHFVAQARGTWAGITDQLRVVLEQETIHERRRVERLTLPVSRAEQRSTKRLRLFGLAREAADAFRPGEWLELLAQHGRVLSNARVVESSPADAEALVVEPTSFPDLLRLALVRPRSRQKILDQKRALLDELANPTGSLPHLVRLVAAPASLPVPRPVHPIRFVNPAVMHNRSQACAVALALGLEEGQALMIQGPPGTGKSTTAAEIDVQLILRDPGVRILVCSHSNHATDNMLLKVLPFLEDASERIARIGFYDRVTKEARPYYAAPDADLGDRNIVFTTIDTLALQDVAGGHLYDYVILDEANRAGVLDSLLALARGTRMILVGDEMQLQPVMSEAEAQLMTRASEQDDLRSVLGQSLFDRLLKARFQPGAIVLLDEQHRMEASIARLISQVFYNGRVRNGPQTPPGISVPPLLAASTVWVDTSDIESNTEVRTGSGSLRNAAEAEVVWRVVRHLNGCVSDEVSVGVITGYAEQKHLLRKLLAENSDAALGRSVEVDTVDAFEGRERDVVIVSMVRSNRRGDVGFLRLQQRLNVALSRARRLLVVVGDRSTLRGGYLDTLAAAFQQHGEVIPARMIV